jgi:hypothetical protein
MVTLDQVVRVVTLPLQLLQEAIDRATDPDPGNEQATERMADVIEDVEPASEPAAVVADLIEETILADVEDVGEVDPENVEVLTDQVEGASVAALLGLGFAGTAIESSSLGQVDQQQEYLMQLVTALQLDDITGIELDAIGGEVIGPALKEKVREEHPAKKPAFEDAIEMWSRRKIDEAEALDQARKAGQRSGFDDYWRELKETPIRGNVARQLAREGVEKPEGFREELERSGVSDRMVEAFAEMYDKSLETGQNLRRNEFKREVLSVILQRVQTGEISVDEAIGLLEDLDAPEPFKESAREVLPVVRDLPSETPRSSDIETAFTTGLIGLQSFVDREAQVGVDVREHPYVLQEAILSELDDDLRTAAGLGLITEGQYLEYVDVAGLDRGVGRRLLRGDGLDEIADERLTQAADAGTLPVDTVEGIGSARRSALEAGGIESVAQLAAADPAKITSVADVGESTAQTFVERAQVLVEG